MNFHDVHIAPESIELVTSVLQSGWIGEGEYVKRFEAGLSELGLSNPVATNSGTAALHLALRLCGVRDGDEVIIPAQTFAATGTAVLQCGAIPIFCDIDPQTGNMLPSDIERHITDQTKAIVPVHYGGLPCDIYAIGAATEQYDITVIEDAAHALGARYYGIPIGSVSLLTAFSFQAIKHLTCGDGGALCSTWTIFRDNAERLRWFGIDRDNSQFSELGNREYDIKQAGYKYHMNDISAAIGLGNMIGFDNRLKKRQAIAAHYREELADIDGLSLLRVDDECEHAHWLFTVLVENRLDFARAMKARGVPVSVVHRRIDDNFVFGGRRDDLPGTDYFDEHQISIPVHSALSDDDVDAVVTAVRGGW